MYSQMLHIKRCNENSLLKEVWEVESNRYCGECLKPLELEEEEEPSVLVDPAVILLCSSCTQIYESIFSKNKIIFLSKLDKLRYLLISLFLCRINF